ncbi:MAG: hypothetical protein ACYDEV_03060 [Acidiferrobacter sp.]
MAIPSPLCDKSGNACKSREPRNGAKQQAYLDYDRVLASVMMRARVPAGALAHPATAWPAFRSGFIGTSTEAV